MHANASQWSLVHVKSSNEQEERMKKLSKHLCIKWNWCKIAIFPRTRHFFIGTKSQTEWNTRARLLIFFLFSVQFWIAFGIVCVTNTFWFEICEQVLSFCRAHSTERILFLFFSFVCLLASSKNIIDNMVGNRINVWVCSKYHCVEVNHTQVQKIFPLSF